MNKQVLCIKGSRWKCAPKNATVNTVISDKIYYDLAYMTAYITTRVGWHEMCLKCADNVLIYFAVCRNSHCTFINLLNLYKKKSSAYYNQFILLWKTVGPI